LLNAKGSFERSYVYKLKKLDTFDDSEKYTDTFNAIFLLSVWEQYFLYITHIPMGKVSFQVLPILYKILKFLSEINSYDK